MIMSGHTHMHSVFPRLWAHSWQAGGPCEKGQKLDTISHMNTKVLLTGLSLQPLPSESSPELIEFHSTL